MHVLPRVREIHQRFEDSLTVIGVHAGKFPTERFTDRIAEACDRLSVAHAVVNDRQFRVWHDYAVKAWPTVIVIDPEGYLALIVPGEFDPDEMAEQLERIEARAESRGTLVRGADPVVVTPPRDEGLLRFPTRAVLTDGRLWIADTGHGRVLECTFDPAENHATVAAEHPGFVEPRGLAWLDGHLYVADRADHAIWRLGGGGEERVRVAGTGVMGVRGVAPGPAMQAALRSPWGLAVDGGRLVIAMAGAHQLWTLDPASGTLAYLAGTGAEALNDDKLRRAMLAQPTGVARLRAGTLAFADCESSAIRTVDEAAVATLVGTGLFDFGDRSGVGDAALLQHCEDVAVHGAALAVADTYNDRLKLVDPATRECIPWAGAAGEKGSLREPGGVWSDGRTMLVADTGHHRVVVVDEFGALSEVRLG